ncbi:hypothetical protein C0995_016471 [Termitomyces sp. Mi166|nr:hypothetical protein C0995_016471 [Termitomyces sp. Mi166\
MGDWVTRSTLNAALRYLHGPRAAPFFRRARAYRNFPVSPDSIRKADRQLACQRGPSACVVSSGLSGASTLPGIHKKRDYLVRARSFTVLAATLVVLASLSVAVAGPTPTTNGVVPRALKQYKMKRPGVVDVKRDVSDQGDEEKQDDAQHYHPKPSHQ